MSGSWFKHPPPAPPFDVQRRLTPATVVRESRPRLDLDLAGPAADLGSELERLERLAASTELELPERDDPTDDGDAWYQAEIVLAAVREEGLRLSATVQAGQRRPDRLVARAALRSASRLSVLVGRLTGALLDLDTDE